jgi:hypothetical protein
LNHGGHAVALASGVGHEFAAQDHGAHHVLHGEDPGGGQGRELAQAVPGGGGGTQTAARGQPDAQVDHCERGLQGRGLGHVGLLAVPVDAAQGQTGLLLGHDPEVAGLVAGLRQVAAHAFFLGALAGEQNAQITLAGFSSARCGG